MHFTFWLEISIAIVLAFGGVVAIMLDALLTAMVLWICLACTVALTCWSYGKHTGWNGIRTTWGSLMVWIALILIGIPIYKFLASTMVIELSPRIITLTTTHKIAGEVLRHTEYGFGVIARVRKTGQITERLSVLEIAGDIDASGNDYLAAFGEEQTFEEIDREYGKRKPYYRISFVSFPINANKIEPGEEFIRFMVLDPANIGSTQSMIRGTDPKEYFGFRGEIPSAPRITTTVPNIYSFVSFAGYERRGAGNGQLLGPRLRDEIKTGLLKFILKFDSGLHSIDPQAIHDASLISLDDWNRQTPQDVFFRNNIWHRAMPAEKDPIIESLK